jgi:endonuclease
LLDGDRTMKPTYRVWLEGQKYESGTINAQIYRVARVEEFYGDLDVHFADDQLETVISALRYSTDDQRHARPNPSKLPFDGDIRSNLASYRNAVERYLRFRMTADDIDDLPVTAATKAVVEEIAEDVGQRIGLERDMQAALRLVIDQLEPGLVITDDGAERKVDSGFIDITARDQAGVTAVIELKAGKAGQRAVGQILSYMGDVAAEDESQQVRGILVASDFDHKAKAAARMVPNLILRRYAVQFRFSEA